MTIISMGNWQTTAVRVMDSVSIPAGARTAAMAGSAVEVATTTPILVVGEGEVRAISARMCISVDLPKPDGAHYGVSSATGTSVETPSASTVSWASTSNFNRRPGERDEPSAAGGPSRRHPASCCNGWVEGHHARDHLIDQNLNGRPRERWS